MSGRRSSNKGARTERAMVRLLLGHGLPARNVSVMYKRGEDLRVVVGDVEHSVEVNCRAADRLDGRDLLIVKTDRQKPLVVLRMSLATEIAKGTAIVPPGSLRLKLPAQSAPPNKRVLPRSKCGSVSNRRSSSV